MTRIGPISLLLTALVLPTSAAAPTTRPDALRKSAFAPDPAAALSAIRALAADPASRALVRDAVGKLLGRDAATLRAETGSTAPTAAQKLRAAEAELPALRQAMLAAATRMTHDPQVLKSLKGDCDNLAAVYAKVAAGYAKPVRIAEALSRRAACLELWRTLRDQTGPGAAAIESEDAIFARDAAKIWGVAPDVVKEWVAPADAPGRGPRAGRLNGNSIFEQPADGAQRGLWTYATCRRIETYDLALAADTLNPAELAHLKRLNAYREMLGLWPYELDPRLTQAARRHSKEMFDLKYFAHWSPTPGQSTHWQRIAAAGYPRGDSENIALGPWTGDEAFTTLFNSPSHHHAWLNPADTAVGVGKWENAWTEDFGAAGRLMTGSEDDRRRATPAGGLLAPQKQEQTRAKPRDFAEYRLYDNQGNGVRVDRLGTPPK
jgi:hypothetical protein